MESNKKLIAPSIANIQEIQAIPINGRKKFESVVSDNTPPPDYYFIANKTSGVEPGFIAIKKEDFTDENLGKFFVFIGQPSIKKILEVEFSLLNFAIHAPGNESFFGYIINNSVYRDLLSQFLLKIYQPLLIENQSVDPPFTLWMFKQDYVQPKTNRLNDNLNVLHEAIGNDISTGMGYNTQEQQLKFSSYPSGKYKFITAIKLEPGYKNLKEVYNLSGDPYQPTQKKGLYQNYLTETGAPGEKTHSIPGVGTLLALMMLIQDPDFIGAYGQNKGVIINALGKIKLFVIDLGKALRASFATRIEKLQDNGHFFQALLNLPFNSIRRHFLYRNSSILYDAPFDEIMMGFLMLKKFASNSPIEDPIIDSYEKKYPGFKAQMNQIEANGLTAIFDAHIQNLEGLKETKLSTEQEELQFYIDNLKKTKKIVLDNADEILKVFDSRLKLTAPEVNMLHNLEKISSSVYDVAPDGKTIISHLQVNTEDRIPWQLEKQEDGNYLLVCDLGKNPALKNKTKALKKAKEDMIAFLKSSCENGKISFLLKNDITTLLENNSSNKIIIKLCKAEVANICEITDKEVHTFKIPLSDATTVNEIYESVVTEKAWYSSFISVANDSKSIQEVKPLMGMLALLADNGNPSLQKELIAQLKCSKKEALNRVKLNLLSTLRENFKKANIKVHEDDLQFLLNHFIEETKELNSLVNKNYDKKALEVQNNLLADLAILDFTWQKKDFSYIRNHINNRLKAKSKRQNEITNKPEDNGSVSYFQTFDEQLTPLMIAAKNGQHEIVKILLENNVDLTPTSRSGANALFYAIDSGNPATVNELLLKAKTEDLNIRLKMNTAALLPFKQGDSPLIAAIKKDNFQIVQILLMNDLVFSDQVDKSGKTPLMIAIECGNKEIIKILIEHGANVTQQSANGRTALHLAILQKDKEIIQLILEHSIDPTLDKSGQLFTPDINVKDKFGLTPLMLAIINKDPETVLFLLKLTHINLNETDKQNKSALMYAAEYGLKPVLDELVNLTDGKELENQNINGETALHLAAQNGHTEICKTLLNKDPTIGASLLFKKNKNGKTAADIATGKAKAQLKLLEYIYKRSKNPNSHNFLFYQKEFTPPLLNHTFNFSRDDKLIAACIYAMCIGFEKELIKNILVDKNGELFAAIEKKLQENPNEKIHRKELFMNGNLGKIYRRING